MRYARAMQALAKKFDGMALCFCQHSYESCELPGMKRKLSDWCVFLSCVAFPPIAYGSLVVWLASISTPLVGAACIAIGTIFYISIILLAFRQRIDMRIATYFLVVGLVVNVWAPTSLYQDLGIVGPKGEVTHDFVDCLYFSMATWTTLGTDFQPTPNGRLYVAGEALLGYLFMAVALGLIVSGLTHRTPEDA